MQRHRAHHFLGRGHSVMQGGVRSISRWWWLIEFDWVGAVHVGKAPGWLDSALVHVTRPTCCMLCHAVL